MTRLSCLVVIGIVIVAGAFGQAQTSPQPAVVSQTEELNALDKQIADAESQLAALRKTLNEQIADVDRNLDRLRKIYRPSYPDIRNLVQQRQILTNRLDELTKKQ